jgi:alpha-glucosidase
VFGGSAESLHNVWPQLWAKLNAEAIEETNSQEEVFFFTRAGFTETIKYTNTMWSGDQHVDFSREYGLPSAIVSTLSMSTIGIGLNHSDIGGYTTILHMKRSKELMMRWAEMNVFTPLFRCHEGNKPESNVQFDEDEETIKHFSHMASLFKQLEPYLHDVKMEYYTKGTPVNRPLFYHYDEEEAYTTQNEFMYGSEILVSPVIHNNERTHEIYLPQGKWVQFITKQKYFGGKRLIESPLGLPIAFYKEDSDFRELFDSIQ